MPTRTGSLSAVDGMPPSVAVTWVLSVWPTSSGAGVYVVAVAPAMSTQAAPSAAQRRHCRVKLVAPTQKVSLDVSVSPTNGWPVIGGGAVAQGRSALRVMLKAAHPAPAAVMFQFTVKSLPPGTTTE